MRAVRLVAPREHLERLIDEAVKTAQTLLNGDRTLLWIVDQNRADMWASVGKSQSAPVRIGIDNSTLVGSVAFKALGNRNKAGTEDSSADLPFSFQGLMNVKNTILVKNVLYLQCAEQ